MWEYGYKKLSSFFCGVYVMGRRVFLVSSAFFTMTRSHKIAVLSLLIRGKSSPGMGMGEWDRVVAKW